MRDVKDMILTWNKIAAEEMQFLNCWDLGSEIAGHDGSRLRNMNYCQKDLGVHVIWTGMPMADAVRPWSLRSRALVFCRVQKSVISVTGNGKETPS